MDDQMLLCDIVIWETAYNLIVLFFWFVLRCWQHVGYVNINGRIIDEWWLGKDLEGTSRGLIEVLFQHFSGRTVENTKNLISDSRCPCWYSNPGPLEYNSKTLPLHQPARSYSLLQWLQGLKRLRVGLFALTFHSAHCTLTGLDVKSWATVLWMRQIKP